MALPPWSPDPHQPGPNVGHPSSIQAAFCHGRTLKARHLREPDLRGPGYAHPDASGSARGGTEQSPSCATFRAEVSPGCRARPVCSTSCCHSKRIFPNAARAGRGIRPAFTEDARVAGGRFPPTASPVHGRRPRFNSAADRSGGLQNWGSGRRRQNVSPVPGPRLPEFLVNNAGAVGEQAWNGWRIRADTWSKQVRIAVTHRAEVPRPFIAALPESAI